MPSCLRSKTLSHALPLYLMRKYRLGPTCNAQWNRELLSVASPHGMADHSMAVAQLAGRFQHE